MKTFSKVFSMVPMAVLAFGLGTARADTTPSPTTPPTSMDSLTGPPVEPGQVLPAPGTSGATQLPAPQLNGAVTEPAPMAPLPPAPIYTSTQGPPVAETWRAPVGVGFLVGGGFEDFRNGTLRSMTGNGGYWNARAVVGTRQIVGLEAAYVGDARSISGLGLNGDSRLMSNGLEGVARLNLPLAQGPSLLEPFAFVGLGWAHYQVTGNNALTSQVASSDDVMTLPYGAGLELSYRGLMADARFTYRQTYYDNLLGSGGNLNNWGVGAQIGFEY
jgi:hypothetical protein